MSRYVEIEVEEIVVETDDAVLVLFNDEEIWLPKSQIEDCTVISKKAKNVVLGITRWIAKEKDIEIDD